MTPTVLVHGNPETPALWDPLVVHLQRDVVRLAPPGFGAPLPAGFGATVPEYRDWLVGELERIGEPVDLVGHDWGGVHVVAVAMARPDLLRSWASDAVGVFDEEYRWHDLAEQWQQPGVGEESIAQLLGGSAADKAARLVLREMVRDRLRIIREGMGASYGVQASYSAGAGGGAFYVESDLEPARAAKAARCGSSPSTSAASASWASLHATVRGSSASSRQRYGSETGCPCRSSTRSSRGASG